MVAWASCGEKPKQGCAHSIAQTTLRNGVRPRWPRGTKFDARRSALDARPTPGARRSTLDARRSSPDARRQTLDARRSTLVARRSTLDTRHSTLDARCSALGARRSTLDVRRSTLDARRSRLALDARRSVRNARRARCSLHDAQWTVDRPADEPAAVLVHPKKNKNPANRKRVATPGSRSVPWPPNGPIWISSLRINRFNILDLSQS